MRIFLTGAAGYIGGSLAVHLRDRGHDVTGLVRSPDQHDRLAALGIASYIGSLTDEAVIARGVDACDVVINTAEADEASRLVPLLARLAGTGKGLVHTGGSSIVVDDAQGAFAGSSIFADDDPFIAMPHRLARIGVDRTIRQAGITEGIRACVISPTMVYGTGRGLKAESHQIPLLEAQSRSEGAGVHVGEGLTIWSHVHIGDLVSLYELAALKAPSGAFFFAENGELSFLDIARAIGEGLGFGGRTASWPLDAAVASIGPVAQVALATNCRVRARNAKELLGWTPVGPSLVETLQLRL